MYRIRGLGIREWQWRYVPLFRTAEKGFLRAQIHKTGLKIQDLAILSCAQGFVCSMQNSTDAKIGCQSTDNVNKGIARSTTGTVL